MKTKTKIDRQDKQDLGCRQEDLKFDSGLVGMACMSS